LANTLSINTHTDDFFSGARSEVTMDYDNAPPSPLVLARWSWSPKAKIHRPRAEKEVKVLLIEPTGEPNSGDSDTPPAPKPHI